MTLALRTLGAVTATVLFVSAAPVAAVTEGKAPPLITMSIVDGVTRWIGPKTVGTGPVQFQIPGSGGEDRTLSVFRKNPKYSDAQFTKDADALGRLGSGTKSKTVVNAVKRLQSNVTTVGGVELAATGNPAKATIVLEPGTYLLDDNQGGGIKTVRKLTVTSKPSGARMPKYAAEITMTGKKKFAGAASIPHLGTIKITNKMTSGTRWYMATLMWAQPGTTAKQVSDTLAGRSDDGSWYRGVIIGSDTLSPGRSQLLNLQGVAGTWALVCYFPDVDKPGTTFAANGMVRMVTMT